MLDVVELTRELAAIPSVTNHEGKLAALVADRLEAAGWYVTRQEVSPEGTELPELPRLNVLALSEPARVPKVLLTTHLDTVPPFIPPSEDERYLYGRGTCDAKGIFAAQWVAAERLRAAGYGPIALLGVVGEETDSHGAKAVKQILPEAGWIIDGEPTELAPARAAKGILALRVRASGRAAHSAYPEIGHSAVHDLMRALMNLLEAELPSEPSYGATTVNVGVVHGGVAPNVFAPSAEALVLIRLGASSDRVLDAVRNVLPEGVQVEITSRSEPHSIHVLEEDSAIVVRFGSDVPYLAEIGKPMLIGPGSIHDAHTAGEKIEKTELARAVEVYEGIAKALFAR